MRSVAHKALRHLGFKTQIADEKIGAATLQFHHLRHLRVVTFSRCGFLEHALHSPFVASNLLKHELLRRDAHHQSATLVALAAACREKAEQGCSQYVCKSFHLLFVSSVNIAVQPADVAVARGDGDVAIGHK